MGLSVICFLESVGQLTVVTKGSADGSRNFRFHLMEQKDMDFESGLFVFWLCHLRPNNLCL